MYRALRTFLLPGARCWDADSQRSYQDLFESLDANKDGKVDVAELRAGLKAMGIFRLGAAQVTPTHPTSVVAKPQSESCRDLQGLVILHDGMSSTVCSCVRVTVSNTGRVEDSVRFYLLNSCRKSCPLETKTRMGVWTSTSSPSI